MMACIYNYWVWVCDPHNLYKLSHLLYNEGENLPNIGLRIDCLKLKKWEEEKLEINGAMEIGLRKGKFFNSLELLIFVWIMFILQ